MVLKAAVEEWGQVFILDVSRLLLKGTTLKPEALKLLNLTSPQP